LPGQTGEQKSNLSDGNPARGKKKRTPGSWQKRLEGRKKRGTGGKG